MFRIKVLSQLNGRQREEVRELEQICKDCDHINGGVTLATEGDNSEATVFLLSYEENVLAGFVTLYQFEDNSAEILIYIHPNHRKRLHYKKIAKAIGKELNKNTEAVYYVTEPHKSADLEWLCEEGHFDYDHSEYMMEWKYSYQLAPTNELSVKELTDAHELREAAQLLAGAFAMDSEVATERIVQLLDSGCKYYGAWKRNELVGIFCLSEGKESVYVFDFAIDFDHQGRGLGKALLKELIRLVQEKSYIAKILIQVGSKNETAFRLYQKNGFMVISQRDYYRVSLTSFFEPQSVQRDR